MPHVRRFMTVSRLEFIDPIQCHETATFTLRGHKSLRLAHHHRIIRGVVELHRQQTAEILLRFIAYCIHTVGRYHKIDAIFYAIPCQQGEHLLQVFKLLSKARIVVQSDYYIGLCPSAVCAITGKITAEFRKQRLPSLNLLAAAFSAD